MDQLNTMGAVVFDLGNVLIDFDHMLAARRLSRFTKQSTGKIFSLFFDSQLTRLFEEGKIAPEDFFDEIKKSLDCKINFREFLPVWNEIFFLTSQNLEIYHLAAKLKQRFTIALLSNINLLHFEYLKEKFSMFSVFDQIFLSYKLQVIKPEKFIYDLVVSKLALKPEQIFYLDDRRELVAAARAQGIRAFQFRGVVQFKEDLRNQGVLIN